MSVGAGQVRGPRLSNVETRAADLPCPYSFATAGLIRKQLYVAGGSAQLGSGLGLGLVPLPAPHVRHLVGLGPGQVVAGDSDAAICDLDHFPIRRLRVRA